jgi:hypothetical protein
MIPKSSTTTPEDVQRRAFFATSDPMDPKSQIQPCSAPGLVQTCPNHWEIPRKLHGFLMENHRVLYFQVLSLSLSLSLLTP